MKSTLKKDQQEIQRITSILFPNANKKTKRPFLSKENQTTNVFHNITTNNADLKTDLQKMRKQLEIILQRQSITEEQLNIDSRRYYQQIKILSDKLSNYPNDILQAGMNLVNGLPFHVFQANLKKMSKINLVGKTLEKFFKRKRKTQKMEVLALMKEIMQDDIEEQSVKIQTTRNLQKILKKNINDQLSAYFHQWRYINHKAKLQQNQQVSRNFYSKANSLKFTKLLPNENQFIKQMQKEASQLVQGNYIEILIYDHQSNTLRGYVNPPQNKNNQLSFSELRIKQQESIQLSQISKNSIVVKLQQKISQCPQIKPFGETSRKFDQNILVDQKTWMKCEMELQQSLTSECLKQCQPIIICQLNEISYKNKLDYPLFKQFCKENQQLQNDYKKAMFYPLFTENKIVGILRQYCKQSGNLVALSDQKMQFISSMLEKCSQLTLILREMNTENQTYQKSYYKQLIQILQTIKLQIAESLRQNKKLNIFQRSLELLRNCYFMKQVKEINVFSYNRQKGNSDKPIFKQLLQGKEYSKEHLMPAYYALKDNNLSHLRLKDHLILLIQESKQNYLYDFYTEGNPQFPLQIISKFLKQISNILTEQTLYLKATQEIRQKVQNYENIEKQQLIKFQVQKQIMKLFQHFSSSNVGKKINEFVRKILKVQLQLDEQFDYNQFFQLILIKDTNRIRIQDTMMSIEKNHQKTKYFQQLQSSYQYNEVQLYANKFGFSIVLKYRFKSLFEAKIIKILKHYIQLTLRIKSNHQQTDLNLIELQQTFCNNYTKNFVSSPSQNLKAIIEKAWNCSCQLLGLQQYYQKKQIQTKIVFPSNQQRSLLLLFNTKQSEIGANYQVFNILSQNIPKQLNSYLRQSKCKNQKSEKKKFNQFSYIRLQNFGVLLNVSKNITEKSIQVLNCMYQKIDQYYIQRRQKSIKQIKQFYAKKLHYLIDQITVNSILGTYSKFLQKLQQKKQKNLSSINVKLLQSIPQDLNKSKIAYQYNKIDKLSKNIAKILITKSMRNAFNMISKDYLYHQKLHKMSRLINLSILNKIHTGWISIKFFNSLKDYRKLLSIKLYKIALILHSKLETIFHYIKNKTKHLPEKETNIQLITSATKLKPMLVLIKKAYPEFEFAIKINNQKYLTLHNNKIIVHHLREIVKFKQQKVKKQYIYHQVIEKSGHQIWLYENSYCLSVHQKNKLTIVSRAIQQTFRKIMLNIDPWLKALNKNYEQTMLTQKQSSLNSWKQARLNEIRSQHYQRKDIIYNKELQTQTLAQKSQLKMREQQEVMQQLVQITQSHHYLEQSIKKKNINTSGLQDSVQEIQKHYMVTIHRADIQNMKQYFRKWRLINYHFHEKNCSFTSNNIAKISVKLILQKLNAYKIKSMKKVFETIACESIRSKMENQEQNCFNSISEDENMTLYNKASTQREQQQLPSMIQKDNNNQRLLTFQNDLNNDCFIDLKAINKLQKPQKDQCGHISYQDSELSTQKQQTENSICGQNSKSLQFNRFNHLQPIQLNRGDRQVSEQQIKKINSGVYKLNYKTIKFLKRMGKLND